MTQQEKQLLLIDMSARLPYGVKIKYLPDDRLDGIVLPYLHNGLTVLQKGNISYRAHIKSIRPYLRKMSSMTEEEKEEFRKLSDEVVGSYGPYHREFIAHCVRLGIKPGNPHECIDEYVDMGAIDWLNAHHFDYRGLIEKGLALEAPEGMYKTN